MTVADCRIRPATEADLDAVFEICFRTADAGEDARALYSDRRLPGYLWAAPYLKFHPEFAFMLDAGGRALGYALAAPDSAAFAARLEREWWPDVRRTVAGFVPRLPGDAAILQRIAHPETHPAWLFADYPAHLHINILPEAQSGGWGRKMIDVGLAALQAAGIRGVHLGVAPQNERAKGFYRHLGFDDVSRDGHITFAMRLNP